MRSLPSLRVSPTEDDRGADGNGTTEGKAFAKDVGDGAHSRRCSTRPFVCDEDDWKGPMTMTGQTGQNDPHYTEIGGQIEPGHC